MAELNNTIVRGNLRVVSQMEAQEILENGTSLANKYLQLSGGTLSGILNSRSILPSVNDSYNLGTSDYKYNAIYGTNIYGTTIYENGTSLADKYLQISNNYYLKTEGDNRTVATTPNNYGNNLVFRGLKGNSYIGSPSSDTYSYLLGLRGWSDNSGGKAHELAFNDSGIYHRIGGTTTWENWEKLATTSYLSSYYLPLAGGIMNGTLESCDIIPTQNNTFDLGDNTHHYNRIYGRYLGRDNNYFSDIYSSSVHSYYVNAVTNGITFYSDYWEYDIGEISHSSIGEEDVFGQYTDYFRIGTPRSYYYDQGGWTELRMSCYTDGEQDAGFDYIAIRTNGPSAHSVLYLPPLRDGDAETLAITSNIPSVLPAAYVTSPPSSNNYVGIKFVLLNSQTYPESSVTKRNGYIYMWY